MLKSLTLLLLFQLAGEVLVQALALPVPGPVVGMLLLYAALTARGPVPAALTRTAHAVLSHLSLLFVPAGVGIMAHFALIRQEWAPVVLTLVLSTTLTLLVTAYTLRRLIERGGSAVSAQGR